MKLNRIFLVIALSVFLFSVSAKAFQLQVLPLEKMTALIAARLPKAGEKVRLMSESLSKKDYYVSQGCKIVHEFDDALSMLCPQKIPGTIVEEKLKTQTEYLEQDFKPHDLFNNQYLGITEVWQSGFTGKGRVIALLDTGIDYNHPALAGAVLVGKSFVEYTDSYMDDFYHGTAMAGIITSDDEFSKGVAPDAKLMVGKVCAPDGCYPSDIAAGIDWAVEGYETTGDCFVKCGTDTGCCLRTDGCSLSNGLDPLSSRRLAKICTGTYTEVIKPDAISLSLGSTETWMFSFCDSKQNGYWSWFLAKKIASAVRSGVSVVIAAGNWPYGVSSPACSSKAIVAGGLNWFTDGQTISKRFGRNRAAATP